MAQGPGEAGSCNAPKTRVCVHTAGRSCAQPMKGMAEAFG